MTDHYAEAQGRISAADYAWQNSRVGESDGSLYEATVGQVHATLALVDAVRRLAAVTEGV